MKVAVLGFGTVGQGVYEMLGQAPGLEQGPVLVRPEKAKEPFQVETMAAILSDSEVGAVAEAMGGLEPARSYGLAALSAGKHFVTANKALVAQHGLELAQTAQEHQTGFLFSAACGGGVPFLHNLALSAKSDQVLTVGGILNGTTNYMLDAMQRRGGDYAAALADAQQLGYAEADPTADVSGLDALRKLVLACGVAFGQLPQEGLCLEGIQQLTPEDIADFRLLGLTCRLLAKGGLDRQERLYAFVEPVLGPESAPECAVRDNFNLARYEGRSAGDILLMGQGAGRYPTASNILRDLSCLLTGFREMLPSDCKPAQADNTLCGRPYYVRLPAGLAGEFPAARLHTQGDWARLVTTPVTVSWMHQTAARLRGKGVSLFFAGIED